MKRANIDSRTLEKEAKKGAELAGKGMRQRRRRSARSWAYFIVLTIAALLGASWPASADLPQRLTINDVVHVERGSGQLLGYLAGFAVQLDYPSSQTVKVNYATRDGTAKAPNQFFPGDYTATKGTLTFNPGETKKYVFVAVKDDILNEPNESFYVDLSSPQNAWIGDGTGICVILDDDPGKLTILDVSKMESQGPFSFAVILSRPYRQKVTVHYATADGTAVAPGDYTATSGTLTFLPGETKKWVTVNIANDICYNEGVEQFKVILSNPIGAPIADGIGIGTILKVGCPY
jgi:hypothetical protein